MVGVAAPELAAAAVPSEIFFERLGELIESRPLRRSLASQLRDERLSPEHWQTVFERELLHLWLWAMRRFKGAAANPVLEARSVLCLQPRHAVALHLLRRAVPFAALGIVTKAAFGPATCPASAAQGPRLAEALGLGNSLAFPMRSGPECLEECSFDQVVLTGSVRTAERLRIRLGRRLVGATGRCSVLLGAEPEELGRIVEVQRSTPILHSCSRLRAAIVVGPAPGDAHSRPFLHVEEDDLPALLRRLHPSVVLAAPSLHSAPPPTAGYRRLDCDERGRVEVQDGFGADPVFGWPGDYCL